MSSYHPEESWLSWMDELSDHSFVVIDHFLHPGLFDRVLRHFNDNQSQFTPAAIGAADDRMIKRDIRGDLTWWLDRKRDTELTLFWELVNETIAMFNRYCYLSLSGYEFHYAQYPPGGHYDKHIDQFQQRNNRMISMVIYLNEDWQEGDGGELEIFRPDAGSVLVKPLAGRCVLFKSAEVPHAVRTSFTDRRSLTGWLLYQSSALGQLFG